MNETSFNAMKIAVRTYFCNVLDSEVEEIYDWLGSDDADTNYSPFLIWSVVEHLTAEELFVLVDCLASEIHNVINLEVMRYASEQR